MHLKLEKWSIFPEKPEIRPKFVFKVSLDAPNGIAKCKLPNNDAWQTPAMRMCY